MTVEGMTVERPIIILGSLRSGTTLLGNLLKHHPDVVYWEEPKHIWRHRHAYRRHDVLTADDATPAIKQYIRREFASYLRASGKRRFAEKTPSNCVRVPFVREVFPDALFIHLIRDGRASAVSARVQWLNDFQVENDQRPRAQKSNTSYVATDEERGVYRRTLESLITIRKFMVEKRRLSGGVWTFLEAPAYIPSLARVVARKMTTGRSFVWGTRFPGIQEAHRTYSLLEVCAMQWAYSVQAVLADTHDLPASQYLELRYEDLTETPEAHLRQIMEFAGLSPSQAVLDLAAERIRPSKERWREVLSDDEIATLHGWLTPLLSHLGYNCE